MVFEICWKFTKGGSNLRGRRNSTDKGMEAQESVECLWIAGCGWSIVGLGQDRKGTEFNF